MKKEPKFYYVYIITNLVLNKQYVGSRICYKDNICDDNYWGSSKYLNADYKIYGKKNFIKEILKDDYLNVVLMLQGESDYIHKFNTFAPNGYNIYDPILSPHFHKGGCKMSKETKQKISESEKGKIVTLETRKKLSEVAKRRKPASKETNQRISKALKGRISPMKGRKQSPETRKKQSESLKGKKRSEETRKKQSDAAKKRSAPTQETKDKIRKTLIGKKQSDETIKKRSIKLKGIYHWWNIGKTPMKGKHHTKTTKEKISKSMKGRISPNKGKHFNSNTRKYE